MDKKSFRFFVENGEFSIRECEKGKKPGVYINKQIYPSRPGQEGEAARLARYSSKQNVIVRVCDFVPSLFDINDIVKNHVVRISDFSVVASLCIAVDIMTGKTEGVVSIIKTSQWTCNIHIRIPGIFYTIVNLRCRSFFRDVEFNTRKKRANVKKPVQNK